MENRSLNASSFFCDFGDGTTSNEANPKKEYTASGNYTIKLTAFSSNDTAQFLSQIPISVNNNGMGPVVSLSFTSSKENDLNVTFEIMPGGRMYSISFGDGQTLSSNEKVITHAYSGRGSYLALLFIDDAEGRNCASINVDL